MPAASTPGSAVTREMICSKIAPRLASLASLDGALSSYSTLDRRSAVRLEAKVHVEHFDETVQQKSRTHQQHAGQRNFRDDQQWRECARACGQVLRPDQNP